MEQDANGQPAGLGVGSALKAARERAGMSLGEVADRLKLSIRQLEAIEHDDFQQLPGATFVRGFVRNYARFLRVDPEPLMARLEQHFPSAVNDVVNLVKHEHQADSTESAQTLARASSPVAGGRLLKWLGLLAVVVLVVAVAVWFAGRQDKPTVASSQTLQPMLTEQAASAAAGQGSAASVPLAAVEKPAVIAASAVSASVPAAVAPVATKTAASAAVPAVEGSGRITLSAHQAAWISVVDANGKKLQFGTLEAGASKELSGTPPFQLKIGNAAQVQLSFNGQAVDLTDKIRGTTAKIELK